MGLLSRFGQYFRTLGHPNDFTQLKVYTERLARRRDHLAYERALQNFDTALELVQGAEFAAFVGSGKGRFTLNTYRRLMRKEWPLFEKVYASDAPDWRKLAVFYRHFAAKFDGGRAVKVPQLVEQHEGGRLGIALFEFVEFVPLQTVSEHVESALRICQELARIDIAGCATEEMRRLDLHFGFDRCRRKTAELIGGAGESVERLKLLQQYCEVMPRFLAHGDLSMANVGCNGLVLDWDNCGFYPPGFDLALILVLARLELDIDDLENYAGRLHIAMGARCSYEELRLSLIYFYCVFLSTRRREDKLRLWQWLLEQPLVAVKNA